ncbi:MAG TPA: PEP-CTERM sorting domain-containing protein [Sedimentisphaerales bacterium]|nr:PEP-CTERM sorting domain-containing protein [Sedimentisphaerales bacterium]
MKRTKIFGTAVFLFAICHPTALLQASYVYPVEVFTNNGGYSNSPDLDMYVAVSDQSGAVDFTFYNESLINSSVSRIYFDDGSLLGIAAVTNGPGTSFSQLATPGDLAGGGLLKPPFVTSQEFCMDGDPPAYHNGVNPVQPGNPLEWVRVTFDLADGATLSAVIDQLNSGALRIGVHIIGLPDGSSESGVTVAEPVTIALLGLGTFALVRRRRS